MTPPSRVSRRKYWQLAGGRYTLMQPHLHCAPTLGLHFIRRSLRLGWWMRWRC